MAFSKINGLAVSGIAKVSGTAVANVAKVNGIAKASSGFTLLNSSSAGINASGSITGFNATGADLLVIVLSAYFSPAPSLPTDSQSNTYTLAVNSGGGGVSRIYYCAAPSVSASMRFDFAGSNIAAAVLAFSGCNTGSPLQGTSSSIGANKPGIATSVTDGSLFVDGFNHDETSSAPTIDSSFTVAQNVLAVGGVYYGMSAAWRALTPAGSLNPTWTGLAESCSQAVFNPA